jgi:murein DD-endopeptidase MepM/ murein hydrolase activator NlpD
VTARAVVGGQLLVLALLAAMAALVVVTSPDVEPLAPASPDGGPLEWDGEDLYRLVLPLAADAGILTRSFGDPRPGNRAHEGEDVLAPKMTPVWAAADGVVIHLQGGPDAADQVGRGRCCALTLLHGDGWRTRYLHLNNDTPGTDDGRGHGIAPGLEVGSEVAAGELIGWVGDSGNAESTVPHLHFELRRPDGGAVDPYPSLRAAAAR